MRQISILSLVIILSVAACSPIPPINPGTALPDRLTPTVLPGDCNAGDQIPYVYRPSRLKTVTVCSHAIGIVDAVRQQADGDIHLALQCANEACKTLVTAENAAYLHNDLLVEFICAYPASVADAVPSCAKDPDPFKPDQAPQVGECVWIDGRGVTDTPFGWGEIHPVGAFGEQTGGCPGMKAKPFRLDPPGDNAE